MQYKEQGKTAQEVKNMGFESSELLNFPGYTAATPASCGRLGLYIYGGWNSWFGSSVS